MAKVQEMQSMKENAVEGQILNLLAKQIGEAEAKKFLEMFRYEVIKGYRIKEMI